MVLALVQQNLAELSSLDTTMQWQGACGPSTSGNLRMHLRLTTGSALAVLLLSSVLAMAGNRPGAAFEPQQGAAHRFGSGLLELFHKNSDEQAPIQLAQA